MLSISLGRWLCDAMFIRAKCRVRQQQRAMLSLYLPPESPKELHTYRKHGSADDQKVRRKLIRASRHRRYRLCFAPLVLPGIEVSNDILHKVVRTTVVRALSISLARTGSVCSQSKLSYWSTIGLIVFIFAHVVQVAWVVGFAFRNAPHDAKGFFAHSILGSRAGSTPRKE